MCLLNETEVNSNNAENLHSVLDDLNLLQSYRRYFNLFRGLQSECIIFGLDCSDLFVGRIHNLDEDFAPYPENVQRIEATGVVQFNMGANVFQIPEKYLAEDGQDVMEKDYLEIKEKILLRKSKK